MSRQRVLIACVVAGGAAAVAACGPSIHSERDESIAVPRGATWAWEAPEPPPQAYEAPDTMPPERMRPRGQRGGLYGRGMGAPEREPAFDNAIFAQRFHRSVEAAMQAHGFARVEDPGAADFLLSFDFGAAPVRRGAAMVGVGVGFGRPWGWYRPWGYYRPWGWFVPWGWGFGWYDSWGWYGPPPVYAGSAGYPGYGGYPRGNRLVMMLRRRDSGEVAWRASYVMDIYDMQRTSAESVRKLAEKMVRELR